METNNNTAHSIYELIADMADARRQYAVDHGFEASDAEIAANIKASLIKMMSA